MEELEMDPKVLGEIIQKLLEDNFELPIHSVIVGINGSILVGRYESSDGENLIFTPLIDHCPSGMVKLPVNIMFVDAQGEAARVLFKAPNDVKYFN
jgi:hypothetical protein